MILDAQIHVPVAVLGIRIAGTHDDDRRGFHPALVAARRLSRDERREKPLRQLPLRIQERALHPLHHGLSGQDVPLDRVSRTGDPSRPAGAQLPGEVGAPSLRVHDAQLPVRAPRVRVEKGAHHFGSTLAGAKQV